MSAAHDHLRAAYDATLPVHGLQASGEATACGEALLGEYDTREDGPTWTDWHEAVTCTECIAVMPPARKLASDAGEVSALVLVVGLQLAALELGEHQAREGWLRAEVSEALAEAEERVGLQQENARHYREQRDEAREELQRLRDTLTMLARQAAAPEVTP
ncbi:MAG: hypothetical protein L0Y66_09895 [Myxococcaceae bacterium]|nr:hypothetical protein [Myxococcaceae bacterium]MCI0673256.1 hypothetical protein [Myxococcaceae bacterium]